MKKYFDRSTFKEIVDTLENKKCWDSQLIDRFAVGAHKWAVDNGCTHVTHVFQPLSGSLGEKHDIMFSVDDAGTVATSLKGKNLLSSEPDASSFPNGDSRPTHQARGNTIWDPQSYLTIGRLGNSATLRIPGIFIGWDGNALDFKTPLLRSEQALQNAALKAFKAMGVEGHTRIDSHCGLEQEFFMLEEELCNRRPDLLVTGRTLLGRDPSRGQDHSDRYFGWQSTKMQDCIFEMEKEFWNLGIPNSTRHREVAPGQYEMAPSFERANQANDNNLVMMQVMKEVAKKHKLSCLLHEKPFANLNGSGKHNNWSFGSNLERSFFKPESPNFLLAVAAFVRGVSLYGDLLRASVANSGNDHRLGGHEAPPAVMSIYVGDEVNEMIQNVIAGKDPKSINSRSQIQDFGVDYLPQFSRQSTDRNRTSPIAFCGNRFEFRAVGASVNTAWSTTILNTITAESMDYIADQIVKLKSKGESDPVNKVIAQTFREHQRVIFNGNGYSEEWIKEAESRGLSNNRDTATSLRALDADKNKKLFISTKVLTETELSIRRNVFFNNYYLDITVELRTLTDLVNQYVLPAAYRQLQLIPQFEFENEIASTLHQKISDCVATIQLCRELDTRMIETEDLLERTDLIKSDVRPAMQKLRQAADWIEGVVASHLWPLPTYLQMIHQGH